MKSKENGVMTKTHIEEYAPDIRLMNIYTDEVQDWDTAHATNLRLSVPCDFKYKKELERQGYIFADRMYDVSVNLMRSKIDYAKMVRITPEYTKENRQEIKDIAHECFLTDRRFHVDIEYNQNKADIIMDNWIDKLDGSYICRYKEDAVGFIAIKSEDDKQAYIHLAAVREKYRPAGIALSMYAYAIQQCREKGYRNVKGYISSRNIPVMNLYTYLGASFEAATDVYLKEVR